MQSAAIFSRNISLPIVVDYDLREWAPDLTFNYDTVAVVEAAYAEFKQHDGEWSPNETRSWEPRSAVRIRARNVLRRYLRADRVLVVCHAGVIEALTGQAVPMAGIKELRLHE